ncbi:hypothetical protein BJ138DRAFT_1063490, partial [Hygrophoropsis aurantiaca]
MAVVDYSGYQFVDRTEDHELEFSHSHQSDIRLADKETAVSTYKAVWRKFYEWEPGYCRQIIDTLSSTSSIVAVENRIYFENLAQNIREAHTRNQEPRQVFEITADPTFKCHPKYESCAPINKSTRDPQLGDCLQFIPYADDDRFPAEEHMDNFESFAWEEDFDPDVEEIQYETMHRLFWEHKMSFSTIDRLNILKSTQARPSEFNNAGLLWEEDQRDSLKWPGASSDRGEKSTSHVPAENDIQGRHTALLKSFCPRCLQPNCTSHAGVQSVSYGGGRPRMTCENMKLSEGEPCGEECFRSMDETFADTVHWEDEDVKTLHEFLYMVPDLFPCQLAVFCLKSCREIFVQRAVIFPEHFILGAEEDDSTSVGQRKGQKLTFADSGGKHLNIDPSQLCDHKGPCGRQSDCTCVKAKVHCQQRCRCGSGCERQRPGCNCRKLKKTCHDKHCPCYAAQVEC